MAGPQLVTERDVLAMVAGGRIVLSSQRIATPAALDAAFRRGIKISYEGPGEASSPQDPAQSDGSLLNKMRGQDGTYVVVVKNGQLSVTRIGVQGPEPFAT